MFRIMEIALSGWTTAAPEKAGLQLATAVDGAQRLLDLGQVGIDRLLAEDVFTGPAAS